MGAASAGSASAETVNIYSYRSPELLKPLLDAFTERTGIETRVLFATKGLEQRIAAEGRNSPADVLLSVDVSRLDAARELGIAAAVDDKTLRDAVPAGARDPGDQWFGLSRRARVIYASKDRVAQDAITYEELAQPQWKGRVCTRSGQHVYSLGLIASMIAHKGEEAARSWLEGLRDNLARKPAGNDRAQVKAIHAGQCDVALGNTYYMGKMETNEKEPEQKEWASSVKLIFPNGPGTDAPRGTHVNLSGMVLAKHAPNAEAARKLMRFLVSPEAQALYASANFEYPVVDGVPVDERVARWGRLTSDELPLSEVAALRKRASELVDETGFDDGPSS